MKIEAENGQIVISKIYNSITIRTDEGKELHICLRDFGFEMKLDSGEWHLITNESDFKEEDYTSNVDANTLTAKPIWNL